MKNLMKTYAELKRISGVMGDASSILRKVNRERLRTNPDWKRFTNLETALNTLRTQIQNVETAIGSFSAESMSIFRSLGNTEIDKAINMNLLELKRDLEGLLSRLPSMTRRGPSEQMIIQKSVNIERNLNSNK